MSVRIYKAENSNEVIFEGIPTPSINTELALCEANDPNINIKTLATNEYILFDIPYTEFEKKNGQPAGNSSTEVKQYLDSQFVSVDPTDVSVSYRGSWNANTNTPDLTNDTELGFTPSNGDWFYVTFAGTYDGEDYDINDVVKYNGTDWQRIPTAEPWEYVPASDSTDIDGSYNRNIVNYTLTNNKDLILPTLDASQQGWRCILVNSSTTNRRLRVMGSSSGSRVVNKGGSVDILWNGSDYVVLNYTKSSGFISVEDFTEASVNHANTIYVSSDYAGLEESTGSVLSPYTDIQDAVDNASDGDTIDLRGEFIITSEITLPSDKSLHFTSKKGQTVIKYSNYNSSNGHIFHQSSDSSTKEYSFENIQIMNAGGYGIYAKSASKIEIDGCTLKNNGWSGQGLHTVLDSSTSGVLGYDSTSAELQSFYSGSEASNGGAIRIQGVPQVEITANTVQNNLRGVRLQDCGINGYGFVTRNVSSQNIDSGIYLAAGSLAGCQNIVVTINSSAYNANNGLLCVGGLNNKFSQNEVNGNWNAGFCAWGSANTTLRDCGLYDNNRSSYNGIGNTGDAKASIQINEAYDLLGNTISLNPAARFIAEILDTQVHYTGLGSNTEKVGFLITEEVGNLPNDNKNIIKVDDVGFIGQDYALDFSEVDLTNLRVSLGDNSYQAIGEKSVKNPLEGTYFELPFSNHSMNLTEVDISVNSTCNIIIREGVSGSRINPYNVNELQALAYGADIQVVLKESNKIQFIVPVASCSIDGYMVNSVLSNALVQLNDTFTNTTGFSSGGGNPVTNFSLSGNDLTITLQDGTSYTVDVTTLGVDENKFVSSGALNGSNLELTMNDSSVVVIDATNMINGSSLPARSNDWYISYGSNAGDEVEAASIVATYENKQPFYNGDFLEKGQEYVWTHDSNGYYVLGVYTGPEETSDDVEITYSAKWSHLFRFTTTGTNRVSETSFGVDVASRYATGYELTNNTVLALRYGNDNHLYLLDISNGGETIIGKSNIALVGDSQIISFGGQNQPNAKFPIMIKRNQEWEIVHDFDNSESGEIIDGVEEDTVLKSNISIGPGEKLIWNMNYFGRTEYLGIGYSGASSGNSSPYNDIDSYFRYLTSEQIFPGNAWTMNTNASNYDPTGGGRYGVIGTNLGTVSLIYNIDNSLELYHESAGEIIMTRTLDLDGSDINLVFQANEAHPFNRIPKVSKQIIGSGPQPVTTFAPDISDQTINITEGVAFNVPIVLDSGSDIVNQYVEEDAPSWAVLNQSTGYFNGTAPAYSGTSDSYEINCKAANAVGGSTNFKVTLNVEELVYTNTKSLKFRDGSSSYLGGNAALISALERSANGSGSSDAWTISIWYKGSTSNQGQTLFYFGGSDTVNTGHIEIKQTNHNGQKRIRLRYGSTSNHIQLTTPSGSIDSVSEGFQHILVTYDGGTTGTNSSEMSDYYSRFKIYIDGDLQSTSNTHSNYGYSNSIVGQNYRFGRFSSGNYARDILLNQLAIWDSDQSSNAAALYNSGNTQDLSILSPGVAGLDSNYVDPDHYYEIETSVSTIQDLVGTAHFVGYNFISSDLVDDAP